MSNRAGSLSLEQRLDNIEATLKDIQAAINGLPLRVRALEIVVYGGCGVVLIAILGALLALVIRDHA